MSGSALSTTVLDLRSGRRVRMLLPENMARIRSQELQEEARRHRLARSLRRGRWWRWLAHVASERAERACR